MKRDTEFLTGLRFIAAFLVLISHFHGGKPIIINVLAFNLVVWPQIASSIGRLCCTNRVKDVPPFSPYAPSLQVL